MILVCVLSLYYTQANHSKCLTLSHYKDYLTCFTFQTNSTCKQYLDPRAYELLYEPDRALLKNIKFAGECVSVPAVLMSSLYGLKTLFCLSSLEALKSLTQFCQLLKASAIASFPAVLLTVAIDSVFGLILGYIEKCHLESLTSNLSDLVGKFEPKVRDYVEKIYRAIALAELQSASF